MKNQEVEEIELRHIDKTVELTNQDILELAYATKELIEYVFGAKLFWEQTNCYFANFYTIRRLLKSVDADYLNEHPKIAEFYREGRELSNDWDRLHWESENLTVRNCECPFWG
jgi:hypothetical protein